jgi:hypothetical protein
MDFLHALTGDSGGLEIRSRTVCHRGEHGGSRRKARPRVVHRQFRNWFG